MKNSVRELRGEQGLTQADLAGLIGVSRQAVIAIESDKHDPSLDLAYRIASVFNLSVETVFPNPHRRAEDA
ncbi:MAG: helix-turn-helix transcriptional regulator [Asticcacaulis sp.]